MSSSELQETPTNGRLDVLHVTEACGGGVRRHLRLIIPELVKRGVSCGICGFGERVEEDFLYDLEYYKKLGVKTDFHPFNHGTFFGVLGARWHIRSLAKAWRPRVVHAHSSIAGYVCRAEYAHLRGARSLYSPHAFALHPSLPWHVRTLCQIVERWEAVRTDAYVFVGRSEIQEANLLGLPAEKFHLIENGLAGDFRQTLYSRAEARRMLGISPTARIAVVPCRLVRQKGLDRLLETIALVKNDVPDLQFMLCGDGPERAVLEEQAHHAGLEDRVIFAGAVESLAYLLPAFDLAILPSLYEGLSYVLLECLAAGIPLIVSDIMANVPRPELREILLPFRLGDVNDFASLIRKCYAEPEWAQERARLGVDFMRTNFTLDSQIQKLVALYSTLR